MGVRFGPFELEARLGRGTAGEVWRGRHARSGVPVALKRLAVSAPRHAFENEVAALAKLNHPNVIRVLDAQWDEDRSWLAMELAEGSARPTMSGIDWSAAKQLLASTLQALAHAHAHDLVHLDVKPENVLRSKSGTWLLADFGIARMRHGDTPTQVMGTPPYMAPEQVAGHRIGPSTDLYAVGCLAWEWATGAPPFIKETALATARAHLDLPLPTFVPRVAVPDTLEPWLKWCLAKAPQSRFQRAADALAELLALAPAIPTTRRAMASSSRNQTWSFDLEEAGSFDTTLSENAEAPRATPPSRRPDLTAPSSPRIRDVGLGLWGLRTIPFIGREGLRDTLWAHLLAVGNGSHVSTVVLRGGHGMGTTRLGSWLRNHSHETGGPPGHFVDARTPIHDPLSELGPTMAAVRSTLRTRARERGLILQLDGAEKDIRLIDLAMDLATAPIPNLLSIITVTNEEVDERIEEQLNALGALPQVTSLDVGPLNPEDHRKLVGAILGLRGHLAQEVEIQTAGNPGFAIQLVDMWVRAGFLKPTESGYELASTQRPELPLTYLRTGGVLLERLNELLGETDQLALEAAAVLGTTPHDSWLTHTNASQNLFELLRTRHLIRFDGAHWTLTSTALRLALLEQSRSKGRWARMNQAAADILGHAGAHSPARLAQHLLEAGKPAEALDPLLRAATSQLDRGDYRSTTLLRALDQALVDSGKPEDDPIQGRVWLLWAWLHRVRGQPHEAQRWSTRAEQAARRHNWEEILPRALRSSGLIAIALGRADAAQDLLSEAMERYDTLNDVARARHCRSAMADNWLNRGEVTQARAAYEAAVAGVAVDDPEFAWMAAGALIGLALVARSEGRLDEIPGHLEYARRAAETAGGMENIIAKAANIHGEAARLAGDLPGAEAHYREAVDRFRAFDDRQALLPTLNLCVVLVCRNDFVEARAITRALLREVTQTGAQPVLGAYARSVLLPCAAHAGDWADFDRHETWLSDFFARSRLVDKDIGLLVSIAGDTARSSSPEHARKAYEMAAKQYDALGDPEMATRLRGLANNLDP